MFVLGCDMKLDSAWQKSHKVESSSIASHFRFRAVIRDSMLSKRPLTFCQLVGRQLFLRQGVVILKELFDWGVYLMVSSVDGALKGVFCFIYCVFKKGVVVSPVLHIALHFVRWHLRHFRRSCHQSEVISRLNVTRWAGGC